MDRVVDWRIGGSQPPSHSCKLQQEKIRQGCMREHNRVRGGNRYAQLGPRGGGVGGTGDLVMAPK